MLRAYVDASKKGDVFTVACVAFGLDRAVKAERKWVNLYGDRQGHMADLHGGKKEFAGITPEEADRLCRGSISLINQFASKVVVVSCNVEEIVRQLPRTDRPEDHWINHGYRGIYPCCLHLAMGAMGESVQGQKISYWMEAGDEFYGSAAQFLAHINQPFGKILQDYYAMASAAFLPASKARLFETADIVAWEWAEHIKRTQAGNERVRGSLPELMGHPVTMVGKTHVRSESRYAIHYSGEPVTKYMQAMQRLMDASSVEELVALRIVR